MTKKKLKKIRDIIEDIQSESGSYHQERLEEIYDLLLEEVSFTVHENRKYKL